MFASCVRVSERGEPVWACEQGAFVNAGLQNGEMFSSLLSFCVFDAMCIVSLIVFADRQPFVASRVCVCAFLFLSRC